MKNKLKFASVFFAIILMLSSFCFATEEQTPIEPRTSDVEQINVTDEAVTTNIENDAVTTDLDAEDVIEEEPEIYEGDLYIFEDTVNMDKLVDGNVYIVGKDVTITGQIAGNLFVIADNLTIGDDTSTSSYNGYVFYNIYALVNKATLYSSCYDLYLAGNDVTIEDSFYLYRDLKIGATNANVYATIGRNVDGDIGKLNLKKDDTTYANIYGNLNYSSPIQLDEETLKLCVKGETNYSLTAAEVDTSVEENVTIMTHIKDVAIKVIFTIFVWLIVLWLAPKFFEKAPALITKKPAKTLSIGLLTLVAVPIICIILLLMIITLPISLIGIALYALAISIAFSMVCIAVTYLLKDKLNLNKWFVLLPVLIVVRIVLHLLTLIPFVGGIISFIALILGLGLIVCSLEKSNKKDDSEVVVEEKIEE